MSKRFPKLTNNDSDFPIIDNVNVYKYDNDFDYSRYDYTQMDLMICTVPWDMGEAHIGNRVISGIGNVVFFETPQKRDKYFDDIPDKDCYRFTTKFKELHRDMYIDVPIPYDVCALYNYLKVHYSLFANDDSPVEYEREGGLRDWFWFIREVEFLAPNTTRLHILLDAFQTFIYDIDVTGMILERGHAVSAKTPVADYLANPIANNQYLLAPDVNFGDEPSIAKHDSHIVLNGNDTVAVVVTDANPVNGSWGSKANGTWNTSAGRFFRIQGAPAYCAFSVSRNDLFNFLENVNSQCPQFFQTIKALCFISESLLTYTGTFSFCGISCSTVSAGYVANDLYTINQSDFGYSNKYKGITKLYTYPYCKFVITDENGNSTEVHIEDTNGKIKLESKISLIWPWLNVNAHLTGIGKAGNKSVSFYNITQQTMPIGGNWYEHLYEWNIPTFGIAVNNSIVNDYATHFDRAQEKYAADNAYSNEIESANATYGDATALATTALANANAQADNIVDNNDLQVQYNDLTTAVNNLAIGQSTSENTMQTAGTTVAASVFTNNSTNNQIDYQQATGALNAFTAGGSGAISGGTTLAAGGGYAAAAGAIGGGILGVAASLMGAAAGVNLDTAQASAANTQMSMNLAAAETYNNNMRDIGQQQNDDLCDASNWLSDGTSANNAYLTRTNATRDYNTATANATRDLNASIANALRNRNTAYESIDNQIRQAALEAPQEFSDFADGSTHVARPMGLFCNVVTQNDYAISRAGDEFLRYGYRYDGQWSFDGNWNIGKHFTYWKLRDFWIRNINIPDMYIDQIRFYLLEGVTIWRNPSDIGRVTIYDNV